MWLFYVPVPRGKGRTIAKSLIGACKCVNIIESISIYEEGGIKEEKEDLLIAKTSTPRELEKRIEEVHPYKTPAIIKIKAEANKKYEKWLNS